MFDAVIVGGSYSGLSAALQLARARRRILVVDAGRRRNRFADSSHGFLSRDGHAPGEIAAEARAQLLAYPTVEWADDEVVDGRKSLQDGFEFALGGGRSAESRVLILAPGVVDGLPQVPGLAERWGRRVFHCPYCHGYELGGGPIGVIASSELSMHQGLMLPDWGPTTLFTNGAFEPTRDQLDQLSHRGTTIEAAPIREISGKADLILEDGRVVSLAGLFTVSRTQVGSPLPAQLGCAFEQGPMGAFIKTDEMKQTSVQGVFACGDAARAAGSVALAVGDGAIAGTAAHRSLMFPGH